MVLLFNANVVSAQQFDVVVCDSCTTTAHFQAKALEQLDIDYTTSFIQKVVVIANLHTRVLKSYLVLFSNEPGFYEREVYDAAVPAEAQIGFDAYIELENAFNNSGQIVVGSIPLVSMSAFIVGSISTSNRCTISGEMNPVPPYVANSVIDIDGNMTKQKVISEMLRTTYVTSSVSIFSTTARIFLNKLLKNRPLTVWTTFNDGTRAQWLLVHTHASDAFLLLPESAIDSDCNPVPMVKENSMKFNLGSNEYRSTQLGAAYYASIGMSNFGNLVCKIVYTGTTSKGIVKPQVACY